MLPIKEYYKSNSGDFIMTDQVSMIRVSSGKEYQSISRSRDKVIIEDIRQRAALVEIQIYELKNGYEIWIPGGCLIAVRQQFSSRPHVHIQGWKINEILRTMVIDKLRNNG